MRRLNRNRAGALQVVDPLLTEIVRSYRPEGFIYDRIVSDIKVQTFTGEYVVFDDQYWYTNEVETETEDRAPSREVDYEWMKETFSTRRHSLKVSFTDDEVEQAGQSGVFDLEKDKAEFLAHRMKLAREIRLAKLLLPTSDGGQLNDARKSTPANNWNTPDATIEADITAAKLDVYDTIGIDLNTIVIPFKVAYAMAMQEDIRNILAAQISGGSRNFLEVGDRVLPEVIHGMKVVIPKGTQKDDAREGGTPDKKEIWGDDVRLLYVDPNAGRYKPSVMKRFLHTPPTIKRWENDDPDVTYIRQHERHDEKVVARDAAHVIRRVLS
ncbi:MAG TPA: hypothetical protein VFR97_02270 [Capillimicrobium sp.]|nr:hypothetical protein [Capillimicrobium sp.]